MNEFLEKGIRINFFTDDYYSSKNITPAALTSLSLALKGFFYTYNTLHDFNFSINSLSEDEELRLCKFREYQENYTQTILHFHHFLELIIKDALRHHNQYLSQKLNNKLMTEKDLSSCIHEGREILGDAFLDTTVEFGVSVKRIKQIPNFQFSKLVKEHLDTINTLNELRNRIAHRGAYFLPYKKLDKFVVKRVLPLVHDFFYNCKGLWDYEELEEYWKYTNDYAEIDPLQEMISKFKESEINHNAIGFYKAMGLAMYRVTPFNLKEFYEDDLRKAIYKLPTYSSPLSCLVCSYDTLFLYPKININAKNPLSKVKPGKAVCEKCGLTIHSDVGDIRNYGIKELEENIWDIVLLDDISQQEY